MLIGSKENPYYIDRAAAVSPEHWQEQFLALERKYNQDLNREIYFSFGGKLFHVSLSQEGQIVGLMTDEDSVVTKEMSSGFRAFCLKTRLSL